MLHREREHTPETAYRQLVVLVEQKRDRVEELKKKAEHVETHWKTTTQPLLSDRYRQVSTMLNDLAPQLEAARGRYADARAQEEVRENAFRKVEEIYERQQRGLDDIEEEVAEVLSAQADRKERMENLLRELVEIKHLRTEVAEEIRTSTAAELVETDVHAHSITASSTFLEELAAAAAALSEERAAARHRDDLDVCPLEKDVEAARRALGGMEARTAAVHEGYAKVFAELIAAQERAALEDVRVSEEEARARNLLVSRQKHLSSLEAQLAREQAVGGRRVRQPDRASAAWAHEKFFAVRDLVRAEQQRRDSVLGDKNRPTRAQLPYRLSSRNPLARVLTTTEDVQRQRLVLAVKELKDLLHERTVDADAALMRAYADGEQLGVPRQDLWAAIVPRVDGEQPAAAGAAADWAAASKHVPPLQVGDPVRLALLDDVDAVGARGGVDEAAAERHARLRSFLAAHAAAVEEVVSGAGTQALAAAAPVSDSGTGQALLRERVDAARDREAERTAAAVAAALADVAGARSVRADPLLPARMEADALAIGQWRRRVDDVPGHADRLLEVRDSAETLHQLGLQRQLDRAINREARRAEEAIAAANSPGVPRGGSMSP